LGIAIVSLKLINVFVAEIVHLSYCKALWIFFAINMSVFVDLFGYSFIYVNGQKLNVYALNVLVL